MADSVCSKSCNGSRFPARWALNRIGSDLAAVGEAADRMEQDCAVFRRVVILHFRDGLNVRQIRERLEQGENWAWRTDNQIRRMIKGMEDWPC